MQPPRSRVLSFSLVTAGGLQSARPRLQRHCNGHSASRRSLSGRSCLGNPATPWLQRLSLLAFVAFVTMLGPRPALPGTTTTITGRPLIPPLPRHLHGDRYRPVQQRHHRHHAFHHAGVDDAVICLHEPLALPSRGTLRLVEQTPATVLLESACPQVQPRESSLTLPATNPTPPTRLFTAPLRVCAASHPSTSQSLRGNPARRRRRPLRRGLLYLRMRRFFEPTAAMPQNPPSQSLSQPLAHPLAHPLAWFGIFQRPYLFDHRTGAVPRWR